MQHVFAAACARDERARALVLFAVALLNTVASYEAEARPDLRPWGVVGLWLSSIAAFLAGAALLRSPERRDRARTPLSKIDVTLLAELTVALRRVHPWRKDWPG